MNNNISLNKNNREVSFSDIVDRYFSKGSGDKPLSAQIRDTVNDIIEENNIRHTDMDLRYSTAINLQKLARYKVGVLGVGGIGTWVVRLLTGMGFRNIGIIDDDIVEVHNIGPQSHSLLHLGKKKVDAMVEDMYIYRGIELSTLAKRIRKYSDVGFIGACSDESDLDEIGELEAPDNYPDIFISAVDNMKIRNVMNAEMCTVMLIKSIMSMFVYTRIYYPQLLDEVETYVRDNMGMLSVPDAYNDVGERIVYYFDDICKIKLITYEMIVSDIMKVLKLMSSKFNEKLDSEYSKTMYTDESKYFAKFFHRHNISYIEEAFKKLSKLMGEGYVNEEHSIDDDIKTYPKLYIDGRMSMGSWNVFALPVTGICTFDKILISIMHKAYEKFDDVDDVNECLDEGTPLFLQFTRDLEEYPQFLQGLTNVINVINKLIYFVEEEIFEDAVGVQEACTARAIVYTGANIASYIAALAHWWVDEGSNDLNWGMLFEETVGFDWVKSFNSRTWK